MVGCQMTAWHPSFRGPPSLDLANDIDANNGVLGATAPGDLGSQVGTQVGTVGNGEFRATTRISLICYIY